MKPFQPLLSAKVNFDKLDYSNIWVSPKYDGIRVLIRDGIVVSRKLLVIPNRHVQATFGGRPELEGYDGEIIAGPANDEEVYGRTYSATMSEDQVDDIQLFTFDHTAEPLREYHARYAKINPNERGVVKVPQYPVTSLEEFLAMEQEFLEDGYEGMMGRAFMGPRSMYKFGRSTSNEGTLLKLKRLEDFEARVVGFEEEMQNNNEATTDALGNTKRSSHAAGKVGKGTLGKMICLTEDGTEFRVGIFKGKDKAWKKMVWENQGKFINMFAKLQKFAYGEKNAPRHPRWIGWRDLIDM